MANEIKDGPHFSWLVSFLAVTKSKSYTKAREWTRISQPTLTKRISKLEKWIGHELLTNTPPIRLTPKGEDLFPQIQKITLDIYNLRFLGHNKIPDFLVPKNTDEYALRDLFRDILETDDWVWPKTNYRVWRDTESFPSAPSKTDDGVG